MDLTEKLRKYMKTDRLRKELDINCGKTIKISPLAAGEYNINYLMEVEDGRKWVLRVNTASQMHLEDQIGYEFNALGEIYKSGRTPKPLYVDSDPEGLGYGILVMEFLEGRPLSYGTDMEKAAECLADIHSVEVEEESGILEPKDPKLEMIRECSHMAGVYMESPLVDSNVKSRIERLLNFGERMASEKRGGGNIRSYINTELNLGNFLINEEGKPSYIIDWEKPLIAHPAQDLGHFLAPTTTMWKSEVVLGKGEIDDFVKSYKRAVARRFDTSEVEEGIGTYISLTCLRGITWCSMAYVQYENAEKMIMNEYAYKKIKSYLEPEFLEYIEKGYFI